MGKHRHPADIRRNRTDDVYTPTILDPEAVAELDTAEIPAIPGDGPPHRVRQLAAAGALLGVLATSGGALTASAEDPETTGSLPRISPTAAALDRQTIADGEAIDRLAHLAATRNVVLARADHARRIQVAAEQAAKVKKARAAQAAQEARDKARRDQEAATASQAAQQSPEPPAGATETARSSAAAAPAPAPAGSAAQVAVNTAMAQLGKPYVWGATGPSSFDCSGLVLYAYAAAGISLPRVSSVQALAGVAVARADIQPGDLVAFYSPVSHIGIYIGNGQVVHAPEPGDVVKVSGIDVFGSITAIRRVA